MIAIAESGSTKCEWVILNERNELTHTFKTQGYNPDFHSSNFVTHSLNELKEFSCIKEKITAVYFYGASCSSNRLNKIISDGLANFFVNASVLVDHDLLAAAYSLYDGEPLTCCIVGTGSNSCFYDGKKLTESLPALGFILGDEAGGAFFGKQLLRDFFYNKLPMAMAKDFETTYQLTWEQARSSIYANNANVYLASFMPFIAKYKNESYVLKMIRSGFEEFIRIHVDCYNKGRGSRVGFVGSIAFVFKELLQEILIENGYVPGRMIKSPVQELVNYHIEYILKGNNPALAVHQNGISVDEINL